MRVLTICIVVMIVVSSRLSAQTFPVETIVENGTNRINLVFLSDGYKADELDEYIDDVKDVMDDIFKQSPFKEYKNYFNVYAIKVPSNESGADHPQNTTDSDCAPVPVMSVDNYFGSTFDYAGIHRLLVPMENAKIASVLADNFPLYDQAFVLVNTSYYGGSGGTYATSSTNTASSEVSIHEIGHSFAFLADEYWIPSQGEAPNRTQNSNRSTIRWKNWLGSNGIDVFEYQPGAGWYRPHQNCKMQVLNVPFCSVCKEAFVERFHAYIDPFLGYSPIEQDFVFVEPIELSLDLLQPTGNTLSITWKKDGEEITGNKDQDKMMVTGASLHFDNNVFEAIIIDTTALTRSDAHKTNHVNHITWTITSNNVTGVEVTSSKEEYDVMAYPNPVLDHFNFEYSLPKNSQVQVSVLDANGKRLRKLVDEKQLPGKHSYDIRAADAGMNAAGIYYITLNINGIKIIDKIFRQ